MCLCYPICSKSHASKELTLATTVTLITSAVLIVNIMTLCGYFNNMITGITNTSFYALASFVPIFILCADFSRYAGTRNAISLSIFIILATIAAIMSLAIPQILNIRTAVWIALPGISLALLASLCTQMDIARHL